jgi:hypothetical protein
VRKADRKKDIWIVLEKKRQIIDNNLEKWRERNYNLI